MLKVNDYSVRWEYFAVHQPVAGGELHYTQISGTDAVSALNDGYKIKTNCVISEKEVPIAQGFSMCHVGDQFNKEEGRRRSLKRAVAMISTAQEPVFTKEDRTQIWEAYRTSTKIPKWSDKLSHRERVRRNRQHQ